MAEKQKQTTTSKDGNGFAIAGFVLALVGIVLSFAASILGLIFSSIGFHKYKHENMPGKGFSIAGLVISIVDIVATIIVLAVYFSQPR